MGDGDELRERVAGRQWYHTVELAPGLETPGFFDLRPIAAEVLPPSLTGRRCLDVATFDGFWALQMTSRGAREVMAIDVPDPAEWDWPVGSDPRVAATIGERKAAGEGFDIVMEALGESVDRRNISVYDLDPDHVGQFDFVYVGSLLLHLRDPVGALEQIRGVCSGEMVLVDSYDPILSLLHPRRAVAGFDGLGRPWWWRPNASALERVVRSAGFELLGRPRRILLPPGRGQLRPRLTWSAVRHRDGRVGLRSALRGDPHLALRARPR